MRLHGSQALATWNHRLQSSIETTGLIAGRTKSAVSLSEHNYGADRNVRANYRAYQQRGGCFLFEVFLVVICRERMSKFLTNQKAAPGLGGSSYKEIQTAPTYDF